MTPSFVLLAFGFGTLAMLGWLAAAAAPWLIHLWSRHRHREAPWAAMQFLLAAMRKNARRLQLQQWVLLAVRTFVIVLVVLAVAEPYGERLVARRSAARTHRVMVIDGSLSMAFREQEISRFERAKQLAIETVRRSRPGDVFTVILMAEPARLVVSNNVADSSAVAAEIEALAQSHAGAGLQGAVTLVQESISTRAGDGGFDTEVHFFTDLQQTTWAKSGAALAPLADQAVLMLYDLGQPEAANLAITDLAAAKGMPTIGRPVTLEATLHQFGGVPRRNCRIELLVDELPVSEQVIEVPANGNALVRFAHRFDSQGPRVVRVRAEPDELPVDDVRSLVVPVREELHVLFVAGEAGAARYLASALNPDPNTPSPWRPIVATEAEVAELQLAQFEAIFLCNVAQLTANDAERLRRYVRGGGGVVIFLGDRVRPASYNALAAAERPLLPATIGDVVHAPEFRLNPLGYEHPIVAPFRGRERAGLLTTPVSRYHRLELADRQAVELVGQSSSGDPFIVAESIGDGRVVMIATDGSLASVDRVTGEPWTYWPTWPSFLPIVRELVAYVTGGQQQAWQHLVGETLTGRSEDPAYAGSDATAPRRILRPDGRTDAIRVQSAGAAWTYSRTDIAGIYSLVAGSSEWARFAVNVRTGESDLGKLDPDQLPAEVHVIERPRQGGREAAHMRAVHTSWSASLLWAALGLLLLEGFMAWFFGRGVA